MDSDFHRSVKLHITNILSIDVFIKVNKPRKAFILSVLCHFLSIKGRINFLQLERFSDYCEQACRNQFEKTFDFFAFNKQLIKEVFSKELVIAFDPSYISKSGRCTFGGGKYWSGVAKTSKWGLDICGFAVVDIEKNSALHLNAWQTPPASQIKEKGLNLLTYYASLVSENAAKFKEFSTYMVADAYFSKSPVIEVMIKSKLHLISRLRDDSVLKYKYKGERTGKKGAPQKFAGRVDCKKIDTAYFELDKETSEVKIFSAIVWSKAFKRDIKLAITIFYKDEKEVARKLYFTTDLQLSGLKIVQYYRSRFQIEFLFRDAKQFTGLTTCQARSENKLNFHFNAALTAVNLAKSDFLSKLSNAGKQFSMSDYKTHCNNALILDRIIKAFRINPNTQKNQNIIKELLEYGKIAA